MEIMLINGWAVTLTVSIGVNEESSRYMLFDVDISYLDWVVA